MTYDFYAQRSFNWLADAVEEQDKRRYMEQWRSHFLRTDDALLTGLHFHPETAQLHLLPPYTFQISIEFRLKTPYISRDETDFYLLDHPVRKDKVFKTPLVAASSWKGALRAALSKLPTSPTEEVINRILGTIREDEKGQVGRLYTYPTFFLNATPALEIINPHERDSGVGTVPISFESVPTSSKGEWRVVYLPSLKETAREVAEDLVWIAKSMYAVLTEQGIGAKTSNGYGLASQGSGSIAIHKQLHLTSPPEPDAPLPSDLPRYLKAQGLLADDFSLPDGSLVDEQTYRQRVEASGRQYKKKEELVYAKAFKWWETEGQSQVKAPEMEAPPTADPMTTLFFASLDTLPTLAETIANQLIEEGS